MSGVISGRLVVDGWVMSGRWVVEEWVMSGRSVVDEWVMNCRWVVDEWEMNGIGVVDEWVMNGRWVVDEWVMNGRWVVYEWVMNGRWLLLIGERNIERPILVKFNSVLAKDAVLERTRLLKGTRIRVDRDCDYDTRMKHKELLQYLWEARKNGQSARLVFDKININGRLFDLEYCHWNLNQDSYGNHRDDKARTSITAKNKQEQWGQATSPQQTNGMQQQPPATGNGDTGRRSSQMTTTRVSRNDDYASD